MILQALNAGNPGRFHGHTRYDCQCGYRFIVADCGQAVQESTCPQCRRRIGGYEYAQHGNRRVDASPIVSASNMQSKSGRECVARSKMRGSLSIAQCWLRGLCFRQDISNMLLPVSGTSPSGLSRPWPFGHCTSCCMRRFLRSSGTPLSGQCRI